MEQWTDYGLGDDCGPGLPLSWDKYGLLDFGSHVDTMGYIGDANRFSIEVDEDNEVEGRPGLVRTPMLELSPQDFDYVNTVGWAYDGMTALGDDGAVYQYQSDLGFFKKLFKGIKKVGKKIVGGVRKGVRKLFKATKFGRALIRIKDKILKVALKIVKPLVKVVGKWAPRLAAVAAMIPGYGTIIAGYLGMIGAAAKLGEKYGVKIIEAARSPKSGGKLQKGYTVQGTPKAIAKYKKALVRQAERAKKIPKRELRRRIAKARKKLRGRAPIRVAKLKLKPGSAKLAAFLKSMGIRGPAVKVKPKRGRGRGRGVSLDPRRGGRGLPRHVRMLMERAEKARRIKEQREEQRARGRQRARPARETRGRRRARLAREAQERRRAPEARRGPRRAPDRRSPVAREAIQQREAQIARLSPDQRMAREVLLARQGIQRVPQAMIDRGPTEEERGREYARQMDEAGRLIEEQERIAAQRPADRAEDRLARGARLSREDIDYLQSAYSPGELRRIRDGRDPRRSHGRTPQVVNRRAW